MYDGHSGQTSNQRAQLCGEASPCSVQHNLILLQSVQNAHWYDTKTPSFLLNASIENRREYTVNNIN